MQIFTCEQGTPEWHEARRGIPTASEFATVMAKGEGKTRRTYMLKLAGEIITGECAESYSNGHMERGKTMEAEARELYALRNDVDPELVGFIRNGRMGCSPDSLIGERGGLEVKTCLPHILIEHLLRDDMPPVFKAQVQGTLLVSGRDWWDLTVYWPKMTLVVHRALPEREYLANLRGEIDRFNDELDALVERVQRHGQPQAVAA